MLPLDTTMAPKMALVLKISYKIMAQAESAHSNQNFPLKK